MSQELDETQEMEAKVNQEVDVEALMKRLDQMEMTNKRLLDESMKNKDKYKSLKSNVESEKREALEKAENWQELLTIEKNKSAALRDEFSNMKKTVLQKELNFQVASIAKDAHDVSDVIQSLPRDLISIDDETLEIKGIEEAVKLVRERKPYFFNSRANTGMGGKRPLADTDLSKEEKASLEEKLWERAVSEGLL